MGYKSDWSDAKAEHLFEFKKASTEIAKHKKLIKKAGKGGKKGAITIDDIEEALDGLERISAVKKKKTGLQDTFAKIEKILDKMEDMMDDGINPYTGGSSAKKWKAILKVHGNIVKEVAKGRKKLDKKMLDETKIAKASLMSDFRKVYPPKNRSCDNLLYAADKIISDIDERNNALSRYLYDCKIKSKSPGAEKEKDAPKSIVVNV